MVQAAKGSHARRMREFADQTAVPDVLGSDRGLARAGTGISSSGSEARFRGQVQSKAGHARPAIATCHRTRTHVCIQLQMPVRTQVHTHTHTYRHKHTRARTHTQTHTHTNTHARAPAYRACRNCELLSTARHWLPVDADDCTQRK